MVKGFLNCLSFLYFAALVLVTKADLWILFKPLINYAESSRFIKLLIPPRTILIKLLYKQYQTLQVFAFGVINRNRVVGGLGEVVHDFDMAARFNGRRHDGIIK